MARTRTKLPAAALAGMSQRGRPAIGLDPDHPTPGPRGIRAAFDAETREPTPAMIDMARAVMQYLIDNQALHPRVMKDRARTGHPGAMLISWTSGPDTETVATKFAVSHLDDGTPRVPSWLALQRDHDFDMRWRPEFL